MKTGKKNKVLSKKSKPGSLKQILKQPKEKLIVKKIFTCPDCKKTFVRREHLKGHSRVHTGEKPYKCDLCGKSFRNCSNLKEHRRIHTGERPYDCKHCGIGFLQGNHLTKHLRIHTKQKVHHECNVCDERFKNAEGLKQHMLDFHKLDEIDENPTEEIFQCHFCPRVFKNLHHFNEHIKYHSGGGCFRCEICGNGFTKVCDLIEHKLSHNKVPILKFQCHICAEYFEKFCSLEVHLQNHQGSKPFRCEICSKSFSRKYNLKKHYAVHKSSNGESSVTLPMPSISKNIESVIVKNEKLAMKKEKRLDRSQIDDYDFDDDEDDDAIFFKIRAPVKRNIFSCEYCDRNFTVERIWLKHVKRHSDMLGEKGHHKRLTGIPRKKKDRKAHKLIKAALRETRNRHSSKNSKQSINETNSSLESDKVSKDQINEEIVSASQDQEEIGKTSKLKIKKEVIDNSSKTKIKDVASTSMSSEEIGKAEIKNNLPSKIWWKKPNKRTDLKCEICDRSFLFEHNFFSHMRVHSEGNPDYSCKVCGKQSKNLNLHNEHRLSHFKKKSK